MQHFISHFFTTFAKSASEPDYYIWLIGTKLALSVRFYLTVLAILAIADVAIVRTREVPQIISAANEETARAVASLPDSFTAAYSVNKLEFKGLKLPYQITGSQTTNDMGLGNTLVTLTDEEKPAANSFATLTPTQLILQGSTEIPLSNSAYPLGDLLGSQPVFLDKTALETRRQQIIKTLPQLANSISLIGIPVWFLGLLTVTTLSLLFLSLLANSFCWIMGIHMPFIKTFQLGLHAIAVTSALDVAKYALFPNSNVSLVVPGYLGIMILVTWRLRSRIVEKIQ